MRHVKPRTVWAWYQNQYNNVTVSIYVNTISVDFCLRQDSMGLNLNIRRIDITDCAGYCDIGLSGTVVKNLARLVGFLTGLKIARKGLSRGRADRSIMRQWRPWETERSISGGDLVINLAGRSICSGRKNSICRVNTLCNGQRDICCRIVCPAAFLISLFIALKNERTIANVTSHSSGIQDRAYFSFFFFLRMSARFSK